MRNVPPVHSPSHDRQIIESITEFAIIATDRTGIVTEWNAGAEQILGWSADEMIGQSLERFFVPEDRANGQARREMMSALEKGRGIDERWHLKADGSRFWASGEMMPLRDEVDEHVGFVKVLRDRTDQRLHGAKLDRIQDQLQLALRATNTGIFDYDLVHDVLVWDQRTKDFFGVRDGETVGYDVFLRGLHADDRAWVDTAVKAAIDPKGSGTFDIEYRVVHLINGTERWIAAKGQSFVQGGQTVRFIGTTQDITREHAARQKLAETEERLRLASRATNDAIWDWTFSTNHVIWNEALETAYGYTPDSVEPTGDWWIGHIHPDDRERVDKSIHAVIDGTGTDWSEEYRFQRADGTYAIVLDRGHVIRDQDGRAHRMLGAMLDLTKVREAESRLEDSRRQLTFERGLLQAVVQQAPVGISIGYADGSGLVNTRLEEMLGHGTGDAGEERYDTYQAIHDDGRPYAVADYPTIRALRNGETLIEEPMRYRHAKTGEIRRWVISSKPVRDENGNILAAVSLVADVEDKYRAAEQQSVLNRELAHRLKNTLAIVQSIATQTLRTAPDLATARDTLAKRVHALSKAHDILLTGEQDAGAVDAIIQNAISLHDPDNRIVLRGPDLRIGPKAALTLALVIHELATNAAKYGALSVPEGKVHVAWVVDVDEATSMPTIALSWREMNGPPTSPPTRKGFGTRLIEMGLSGSSGGSVEMDYAPDGLKCRIVAPLTELQADI